MQLKQTFREGGTPTPTHTHVLLQAFQMSGVGIRGGVGGGSSAGWGTLYLPLAAMRFQLPSFARSLVTLCMCDWAWGLLVVVRACVCVCVIACVRFTHWLWSCSSITAAAAPGSRRYWPSPQSLLANSCFILWQFALMKSRRSPSDLCSLSIFNHVILIWGWANASFSRRVCVSRCVRVGGLQVITKAVSWDGMSRRGFWFQDNGRQWL